MKTTLLRIILVPAVVLAFGILICGPSCSAVKEEARETAKSAIDCTKAEAVQAIAQYAPAVEQVIVDSIGGDGKLDAERVKSATKTFATDTARCVLASTIARLMKPPTSSADAPQAAPLGVDLVGLLELRKSLGDQRYKLPGGDTL